MKGSSLRCLIALFSLALAFPAAGYSILTHEQVVDIAWKDELEPLLLQKYPQASDADLRKAHAYAYGGCLVHDMGYYPLGSKFFTDLTHYVRSGEFVLHLVHGATNLNEYAFALGALAHYCSDNVGHPSVNRAVAMAFPKLKNKFGEEVTYAEDAKSHIRVEFGFDMTQVAKNRYTSDRYREFIGFQVSKPLLERAFYQTYSLRLDDVIGNVDLSVETFRRAASKVIPEMTRVALAMRRSQLVKDNPTFSENEFLFKLSRSEYEKEWGKDYQRPGFFSQFLAFILRWIPKVGPLKALAFKVPDEQTEELYVQSVNHTVETYRKLLHATAAGQLELPNLDFDTGRSPSFGEYPLADKAYARLLDELAARNFKGVPREIRDDILRFYAQAPDRVKKGKRWHKIETELAILKATVK
jgi:hypothetical protein